MTARAMLTTIVLALVSAATLAAQAQMPDPRLISGVPLPAGDLPAGTVSVRVIRGTFANNVADASVEFTVDGKVTTQKTDSAGRAQLSGLKPGARLKASVTVDGKRLESQEITIESSGIRFVLAGDEPGAAAAAASPPVKGAVVLGPGSRVVTEFSDDRLIVFYVLSILNSARTPVDIGGPLIVELPQGARSASLVEDSSTSASANGPRVIVTGPFPPGTTKANVRFELPYSGPVATLEQRWPAPLQELEVFVLRTGDMGLRSPQIANQQATVQQGQSLIVASGPAIGAGVPMTLEITGLPYHPTWPRTLALVAAGVIAVLGIWAAAVPSPRGSRGRAA